ncbi:hypothetical protein TIFTF001_021448 [Ficus carica]|uniref:Uncharacterized protein n=1 Tax=Ficus carica TaxID=3494 RepID=A0AA88AKE8_FICCA|nr:hypothetical protein TIFTF001_021448 [Ficus carica]
MFDVSGAGEDDELGAGEKSGDNDGDGAEAGTSEMYEVGASGMYAGASEIYEIRIRDGAGAWRHKARGEVSSTEEKEMIKRIPKLNSILIS